MSKLFVLTERPSIYLASKSPRRQELLRQLGVDFTELLLREAAGRRRDIVEASRRDEPPIEYIKRVARTKAAVGWHQMGRRGLAPKPVLAADTEVVLDGAVLGKPKDATSATDMLRRLHPAPRPAAARRTGTAGRHRDLAVPQTRRRQPPTAGVDSLSWRYAAL